MLDLVLVLALYIVVEVVVREAETMEEAKTMATHSNHPIIRMHILNLVAKFAIALDIWHSTAITRWITPSRASILCTTYSNGCVLNWYVDSGAANHITNDLQNLSVHSGYQGTEQVTIGNGQGLH